MEYYVYILFNSKHDKFYIGQTYNLTKRLLEHNQHLSKYTSKYDGEWEVIYQEIFNTRKDAMRREKFFKNQKNSNFYRKISKFSAG
jgi:putative endonuclease